jgi:hypothetical protein
VEPLARGTHKTRSTEYAVIDYAADWRKKVASLAFFSPRLYTAEAFVRA